MNDGDNEPSIWMWLWCFGWLAYAAWEVGERFCLGSHCS
jgi:hypothetical protein